MENQDSRLQSQPDSYTVEVFNDELHMGLLISWLKARDMSMEMTKNLPSVGFVIFESHRPIAIGFLRQVEGHVGICEGLCTNPEIEPSTRDTAADIMVERLIEAGRELKFTTLMAWTIDKHTLERSLRHGFVKNPSTLIAYDILQAPKLH